MRFAARAVIVAVAATSFSPVFAQTWCGKNYLANQTVVPPSGQFQLPPTSTAPLVAFRCSPAFRPYLEEDATSASIIVDAPIVYRYIQGATPISLSNSGSQTSKSGVGKLSVTISINNHVFAQAEVPVNATGFEIPVDLSSLQAQKASYNVICDATYQPESSSVSQKFATNSSLLYLPDNTNGSVVKTDLRTGALWVRPLDGKGGSFKPFIPQGFYISFDQYLEKNISYINQLKIDGFNTIHPIPPYDNATVFQEVLNRTAELGLYLIYDMRSSYENLTAVAELVKTYGSLPNLLLWETAHEPDGNSDPLTAAQSAYDLIYELDGYHPVSIVLNCQDYNFAPYVAGADIVLEDAYPLGINATWSTVYDTPCTPDFGHCGCDNCQGYVYDIKARIQSFKDRLNILGYDRSKTVWTIPQAFGLGAPYWNSTPTGQEWAAIDLTSFNHGATGSISFSYPTTTGNVTTIEATAMNLVPIIAKTIQPFLVNPHATYDTFNVGGVDAGLWYNGTAYLLLVANLNSTEVYVPWGDVGLGAVTNATTQVQRILSVSQNTNATGLNFRPGGIGIYTATPPMAKKY